MELKSIEKTTYRKNLNRLIIALITFLTIGSIGISQLLIHVLTDAKGNHFALNLTGVAITAATIVWLLNRFRDHPTLYEIVYVWDLKQELNRISRKLKKLQAAVDAGDKDAMIIMNFSYHGSRQLYELDDNTITLDQLENSLQQLERTIQQYGFHISLEDYQPGMLKKY